MQNEPKYWNPVLETLECEKIRDLQLRKFKRIFKWAYENSKFYRALYDKVGITPRDIHSNEDLCAIPKVDKAMMQEAQSKAPFPYGDTLSVPLDEVTEFHQTSGTTGQPVFQADTWQDWEWWTECWSYILWAQGYRPHDRVFIPFGYNIFVAFWAGHYAAEKIGCEVAPGGVLDTKARILKLQEIGATALMGTPTYVLSMASTAENEMDINPASLSIEKITCAGEPGACIPGTKKRIETAWGAKVYDHAGATEIGAWSYECLNQPGGLHVNEAMFLVEIEDIETGELIEETGRQGKMIITALDRMAMPCIRFDSKDIIEWAPEPCSCGRSFRLIKGGVIGRTDDIVKVKGVLLSPTAIEKVVRSTDGIGDEYEVIVDRIGDSDRIRLRLELLSDSKDGKIRIEAFLSDQLRLKTNLRYELSFHDYGSLPRYEIKARRFRDMRKKE